ncbi:hypothetical protein SAMN04488040_3243 [Sulfitobacter marinus]|uniref:Uncharacterized protein n=1 Tax=Sulfitobacter marinus TaxID=394264 RepID=A0A1I6VD02_9RHOB|nr:hypothetical protein [Sulfitobacter marinus]SFT11616.1 hypothetical protein SAMN04488040_3243 [Sulfitobacter marinus]
MAQLSTLHVMEQTAFERPAPTFDMTSGQRAILNQLRLSAMTCRAAARTDLFEACALLTMDGEDAKRTFVETFIKCLPAAAQKQITWFAPGTAELSFDESWVMRCLFCIWDNETSNLSFLLKSRITPADRRYIGFLLGRISDQFSQI